MTSIQGRRRLTIALALSLGLNLFLVGGMAIRAYQLNTAGELSGRPLPPNLGWLISDLEPARQEEMRAKLHDRAMEGRSARIGMFKAQRNVNNLMAAQPFDHEALTTAFANLRAAAAEYQRISHAQTADALSQLSPEERIAALKFLERRGPRESRSIRNGERRPSPEVMHNADHRESVPSNLQ